MQVAGEDTLNLPHISIACSRSSAYLSAGPVPASTLLSSSSNPESNRSTRSLGHAAGGARGCVMLVEDRRGSTGALQPDHVFSVAI